jgi:hypothetical protein
MERQHREQQQKQQRQQQLQLQQRPTTARINRKEAATKTKK